MALLRMVPLLDQHLLAERRPRGVVALRDVDLSAVAAYVDLVRLQHLSEDATFPLDDHWLRPQAQTATRSSPKPSVPPPKIPTRKSTLTRRLSAQSGSFLKNLISCWAANSAFIFA